MFYKTLGIVLILLQVSTIATASEVRESQSTIKTVPIWIAVDPSSGLVSAIPSVSEEELLDDLTVMHSALQTRQNRLAQIEKDEKFSVVDGLITAAMPGGMIYAAIKQQRHHKAVLRLNAVNSRLTALNDALVEYKLLLSGPTMVAIAPNAAAGTGTMH